MSIPAPDAIRARIRALEAATLQGVRYSESMIATVAILHGLPILEHLWLGAPLPSLLDGGGVKLRSPGRSPAEIPPSPPAADPIVPDATPVDAPSEIGPLELECEHGIEYGAINPCEKCE